MDRAALEKPFPQSVIKSRKGAFGQVNYVEGVHYIRRLNEVFDGKWSWRIVTHEIREHDVIVQGELTADGVVRQAFGGGPITYNKNTGEVVALADDLKSASTDALKKACSLLGIGLDLYGAPVETKEPVPQPPAPAPQQSTRTPSQPIHIDEYRLTAKQLKAIWAIATKQGLGDADVKARCKSEFGCMPEFLTKRQASGFIDLLSQGATA